MNVTPPQDSPASPEELRVLIVEDSEIDAELLVHELQRFGYRATWQRVDSAPALQAALTRQPWDIVLADYSMPGFTGLDALALVQASGLGLPFILISGAIGEETAVAAIRAGAQDYLLKDRLARLGPAVRRGIQEAEERQARRQAEDQLRQLFHAVEQSPAVITITDLAGNIEYVNPRFTTQTGYTLEEVRGRNSRFLKSGRISAAEYSRLWATIAGGGEWRGEMANLTKTGALYWESAAISPVRDSTGRITHYVKVAEDITERKRVEESLRKLESQLRQAQKTEALGELAGGIAHDFSNYLGTIIMNAQLVRNEVAVKPAVAEYMDRVLAASRQAAGLARQMLTFSRRDKQERRPLELGSIVRDTLRLLQGTIPAQIRIELDIPAAGRPVLADAAQIQQVIVNLWTNACHAIGSHSGHIAVALHDIDADAALVRDCPGLTPGRYVRLTFRDDGCGMAPDVQARIFEPFFTTQPEGKGTGLGLPAVQSILRGHEGAIRVESQPGKGTAFFLYFPEFSREPRVTPRVPEPLPRGRGQRILLVDDHNLVREGVREMLEQLGYEVAAFGNPVEALATFRSQPQHFDLLFTDLSMREMSGADLSRQVVSTRADIPIIISSGYELSGMDEYVRELGIREVLAKPLLPQKLAVSLARAFSQGRASA